MFVTLEFDSYLFVVHAQVTVAITGHGLRHYLLHFLRDEADVSAIAAVVAEAIVAKSIGEMAEQNDVVLDGDVGSPSTATTAAAATTSTTEATAAATAEATAAAASAHSASESTVVADARATASRTAVGHAPLSGVSDSAASARWSLARMVPTAGRPLSSNRPCAARPLSCTGSAGRKLTDAWPLPDAGPLN